MHGNPENRNEKTDDLCITTLNEHLQLSITEVENERTHRIGKPRDSGQKVTPTIIWLVRLDYRKSPLNREKSKGKLYCNYGEFNSH